MRTRVLVTLVTIAAVALVTDGLAAQSRSVSSLRPGERVKYTIRGNQWSEVGVLSDLTDSSLVVQPRPQLAVVRLAFDSIAALSVSGGRRSARAGALHGAGIGLRIGLVVGTVWIVWAAKEQCVDCGTISPIGVVAIVSAGGTVALAGVGALIGTLAPGERWVRVSYLERAGLRRSPGEASVSMGILGGARGW
jgi:hypothetical protein